MNPVRLGAILTAAVLAADAGPIYTVTEIPLPSGSTSAVVAGLNASGQVAGFSLTGGSIGANFLYTPGTGTTNIEGTGLPSHSSYEGSGATAINGSGQILLASGLLYTPGQAAPQNLEPAVSAAFPLETGSFHGLNDRGEASGYSIYVDMMTLASTAHVFRYSPGSGVVSAASGDRRSLPAGGGPFLIDNAGDVVYSPGSLPSGANIFTEAGTTIGTGCGFPYNGFARAINNNQQVAGGWGPHSPFPLLLCSF